MFRDASTPAPTFDAVKTPTNRTDVTFGGRGVEAGASVIVTVNGVPVNAKVSGDTFETGSARLREGENVIVATATDAVGNVAESAPLKVVLDTVLPRINFIEPKADAVIGGKSNRIVLTYEDNVGIDAKSVALDVDGSPVTITATAQGAEFVAAEAFSDGKHLATVVVKDLAGNQNSRPLIFYVDGTPPSFRHL